MNIPTDFNRMLMENLDGALGIIRMDIARAFGDMEGGNATECDLGKHKDYYKGYGLKRTDGFTHLYVESDSASLPKERYILVSINDVFDFNGTVGFLADGLASFMIQMIE